LRTFLTPRASLTAYQDLLADAERAAAVEPSADDAVNALGAAQYRTGRFQEAVATLEHCRDLRECDARINSAFLAMAYSHVGRQNEAEALLTKLKAMPPSSNPEEQGLLREVGVVVGTARHR
jgi:Flp pilus assembly protein TadD